MRNDGRPIVGVDLRGLEPGFKAHFGRGTGRYAAGLWGALQEQPPKDLELRGLGCAELAGSPLQRTVLKLAPLGRETLRAQCFLPSAMRRSGVDLVHFLAHGDAPSRSSVPYIVTVLDLIPLKFPELYKPKRADWRFKLARELELRAIKGARMVLAISEATKRDVIELLGLRSDRVVVTPLAASSEALEAPPAGEIDALRTRLGLEPARPVLLYIGGIDARKNVSFMLKVFKELSHDSAGLRPYLVLAGAYARDARFPALVDDLERLGIGQSVKLAGFVSDRELAALYRLAALKIFPSLYEGFGLPVLEAMLAGLPVVAGRNSSIPEVAGDAAVLLPDNDAERWVREIKDLLGSPERLSTLKDLGLKQAKLFSWSRTAELTLQGYRQALAISA